MDTIHFRTAVVRIVGTDCADRSIRGTKITRRLSPLKTYGDEFIIFVRSLKNFKPIRIDKKTKGKKQASKSNVCTITNERHQVKTYMDNSNGIRNTSSNSYNKVRKKLVISGSRARLTLFGLGDLIGHGRLHAGFFLSKHSNSFF